MLMKIPFALILMSLLALGGGFVGAALPWSLGDFGSFAVAAAFVLVGALIGGLLYARLGSIDLKGLRVGRDQAVVVRHHPH